jgi:hypothetical protein
MTDPIERILRTGGPDATPDLPPLVLPDAAAIGEGTATRLTPARPTATRAGRGPGLPLLAVVAAAAVIAVVAGARLAGPLSQPSPSVAASAVATTTVATGPVSASASASADAGGRATFNGGGITFTYPAAWHVWQSRQIFRMGSSIVVVGTGELSACGAESIDINCASAAPFRPGEIRVFVGTGASPLGSIEEPAGGFTRFVDGMPVVEREIGPIPQTGQEATVDWQIGMPGVENNWYTVEAGIRGPGLDALREEANALVESIRFDRPAPSLPIDPAAIDGLVAKTVDALDREARDSYHSRYYACFPRKVGASEPTVITDGPGGPLASPVEVVCSVSARPLAVGLLEVELDASWPAGPGYAAGTVRSFVTVKGDGEMGGMRNPNDTWFPVVEPATPAPATTPIALAPGSLVEVLYPGVSLWGAPNHDDALSDTPFGQRLWIVSGPVPAGGEHWYRVQWVPTPTYDAIPAWISDTFEGHPVVEPVEARCPTTVGDVPDVTALVPAERLACFGDRPITFSHVWLASDANATAEATGSPGWLARSATIAMFGSGGPDGVEGPLLVRSAPSLGDLPLGTWLQVTGHFDDAAASMCERRWADSVSGPIELTPAEQVLTCREQFVVTEVHAASAP